MLTALEFMAYIQLQLDACNVIGMVLVARLPVYITHAQQHHEDHTSSMHVYRPFHISQWHHTQPSSCLMHLPW